MFKEQKENMVRVDTWTKRPCVPLSFDDLDQYLDFMSVWSSNWSSCDPGHMERTDFSDEVGSVPDGRTDDIDEPYSVDVDYTEYDAISVDGEFDGFEGFLMKDRSRALRRRSTALHKKHVKVLAHVLDSKSNNESSNKATNANSSSKTYKRVSFPCNYLVELTSLSDELDAIIDTLTSEEFFNILSSFVNRYSMEASYLYPSVHVVGKAPVFYKRAKHYKKYSELYSRKTNHEKKRAKVQKAEYKAVDMTVSETTVSTNIGKEHFDGQHVVGRKANACHSPAKLQETKISVVLAKPQHITLVSPRVFAAGLPLRY